MPSPMSARPSIDNYQFGRVVVDGRTYTKDLIILPGRVLGSWWRKQGHSLSPEDLEAVLAAKTEVLVVGTGAFGRLKVPAGTRQALEAAGIEVLAERTDKACQTYNAITSQKAVAAALHLTC